jgi:hypothetical protein
VNAHKLVKYLNMSQEDWAAEADDIKKRALMLMRTWVVQRSRWRRRTSRLA